MVKVSLPFAILVLNLFLARSAFATCPVCVLGVGGGLVLAKKLGIDDLLVTIWISGLNTAIAFWLSEKIKRKFFNSAILWTGLFYFFTVYYLIKTNQIWYPNNLFWGLDKVLLGLSIGVAAFLLAILFERYLRKRNKGKIYFSYQKVIIPIGFLGLTTLVFYALL